MKLLLERIAEALTDTELDFIIEFRKRTVMTPPVPPDIPALAPPALIRIPGVQHEYSTMDPWNLDMSALILHHPEGFVWLHHGDGRPYLQLPGVHHSSEIRWSRQNPHLFYFIGTDAGDRMNTLKSFDVSKSWAKAISVVHEFTEYAKISGRGESDISPDGDAFVFIGNDREIFTYKLSTDTKSKVLNWTLDLDSLYITGTRVLVSALSHGIYGFDHDMNPLSVPTPDGKVAPVSGHMDVCTQDDEEYLIWINARDTTGENKLAALKGCRNGVVKIRLKDGAQTCLLSDTAIKDKYAYAVHISGVDNKGWVLVSTYRSQPDTPLTPNANKLLKVKLDGSGFEVLQDFGAGVHSTYMSTPRAAISHDGSRYLYDLNGDVYIGRLA